MALGAAFVPVTAALADLRPGAVAAGCVLGWMLFALARIDIREMRLPDLLTLPLLCFGLGEAALLEPDRLLERTIGAIAGYSVFRITAAAYAALRGRHGLGLGDAKLLGAAGAWVGWEALPALVLIAALAGLASALVQSWRAGRFETGRRLPFGPFLALATWAVWLTGRHGPIF